jgi:ABC-type dipeptide/oligopeptide/nickel transport system ATPase component
MMEALLLADRICVMERGRIVEVATPATLLTRPVHPYTAALVRSPKQQADRLEALSRASGE